MSAPRLLVSPDPARLAEDVADALLLQLGELLAAQDRVDLCLTGGSSGIGVLRAVAESSRLDAVAWDRIHFWWGDDRYVPANDPDRNELQARDALLGALLARGEITEANIHPLPPSGVHADIETAARVADDELSAALQKDGSPGFDICLLGMGPDGHVASLFPGHASLQPADRAVIAEPASPKPPPERLTLTLAALNASAEVWFVLAGTDKASALRLALGGAPEVPAARVRGRRHTFFFADAAAAPAG